MLKRKFILQDIHSKRYAFKHKEGYIFLSDNAYLFDTKTEIYEFIKLTNKELEETGNIIYFKIDEVIY